MPDTRSITLAAVFGAFVGGVTGAGLGYLSGVVLGNFGGDPPGPVTMEPTAAHEVSPTTAAAPHTEAPLRGPARDAMRDADGRTAASSEDGAEPRAPGIPEDPDELFSPALLAYARAELAAGWARERDDTMAPSQQDLGLALFQEHTRALPGGLGRRLARQAAEQEEAEAAAAGFGVLAAMEGAAPLLDLVDDADRFGALFEREAPERGVDGTSTKNLAEELDEGVTLLFPPGVHHLPSLPRDPFPRDVTLAGAGMDATLLLVDELDVRVRLERFAIRDCTVQSRRGGLFDLRREAALLLFERVRFVGFDFGAGCSCLMSVDDCALIARDCRFEGGYGRAPDDGYLFDPWPAAFLARFELCTFSRTLTRADRLRSDATVLFQGCAFRDHLEDLEAIASKRAGITLKSCSIQRRADGAPAPAQLDLADLFPEYAQKSW